MQPHQQRVVDEKKVVDENAKKLSDFIGFSDLFLELPEEDQELMKEQNEIMWQLSEVLGERIKRFY